MLLARPALGVLSRKRQVGSDRALDRQVAGVLELQRLLRLPAVESLDVPRARVFVEQGLSPLDPSPETMAEIIDTSAGGRPIRIYVPEHAGPHWVVWFHGGGGTIGSIRSTEPTARYLAAHTGMTVASVDYRLGPEHPHPAAIDDAIAAWRGLVPRIPARAKIAVAGDSFGGFLATHVDHAVRAAGDVRRPDHQVLIYPMTDLTMSLPSIVRLADGYLMTRDLVNWFRTNYMGDHTMRNAVGISQSDAVRRGVSPLFFADVRGAAPAIVVTAGFDPLVDEGDGYAAKLQAAGVPVVHRQHPSLIHGFLSMGGGVRAARIATDQLCADVVAQLA